MTSHDPTDIAVEMLIDGTWVDTVSGTALAPRVRGGNGEGSITISRGVADQQSGIAAQSATFTLENTDGLFNDDNPDSPLYHLIPLNTQIRFGVKSGGSWDAYVRYPEYPEDSDTGQYVSTADKASLDITGDIDIRVEFSPQRTRGRELILCSKYLKTSTNRSWLLHTSPEGGFIFHHSTDGTLAGVLSNTTTATIAEDTVRIAVRVTLDVNNGAAGRTYTWYTADSIAGPWTTLETTTVAGTTNISAGAANVEIGTASNGNRGLTGSDGFAGKIHALEIRDGIGGTLVADFKPADQPTMETRTWVDTCASPNTWTFTGDDIRMASDRVRLTGQLGVIPLDWDSTGRDIFSTCTASGLLAQLNSSGAALQSCVRRFYRLNTDLTDYWPCEDADGATRVASAVAGGGTGKIFDCSFAAQSDFPGSTGMMTFNTASSSFAKFSAGTVPADTGATTVIFYFNTSGLPASDVVFATAYVNAGTVRMWRFTIGATTFTHTLVDSLGATVATASTNFGSGANPNGQTVAMCLQLSQEGANVRWQNVWHAVGSSTFYTTTSGGATFAGTCGQFSAVNFSVPNANLAGAKLGHLIITHALTAINSATFANVSKGFSGELFGVRAQRLCAEEGVPFQWRGDLQATQAVGAQTAAKLYDILTAGAKVAGGILTDARDTLGIEYITQQYLGNRRGLELSYSGNQMFDVGRPIGDLRYLVNDFTASRDGGSSARHEVTVGRKSVNDPPDGAGRWEKSDSFAASTDAQTILMASRETFVGTWPQRRIPNLTIGLHRSQISGTATLRGTLMRDVIALDLGDPVNLAGLSTSPLPPDDLLMSTFGYTERISNKLWSITLNTVPAGPFQVPILGDYSGRIPRMDADDETHSLLKSALNSTDTSFVVKTDAASTRRVTKWVSFDDFPAEIGTGFTATQSVIDNFNDNSISASWDPWGGVQIAESSARMNLTTTSGTAGAYYGIQRTSTLNISGIYVGSKLISAGNQALTTFNAYPIGVSFSAGNEAFWAINQNTVRFIKNVSGVQTTQTSFTYVSGTHVYFAIGIISGSVTGVWSRNGTSWYTANSFSNPFGSTTPTPYFLVGTDGSEASTTTLSVDDYSTWTSSGSVSSTIDINIGGEKMTVSDIGPATASGGFNEQTFTVTRSVNGVTKSHSSLAPVMLWDPFYLGME